MAEIVSEDVMDWARDLAALQTLFAGEPFSNRPINKQAILLQFVKNPVQKLRLNKVG